MQSYSLLTQLIREKEHVAIFIHVIQKSERGTFFSHALIAKRDANIDSKFHNV